MERIASRQNPIVRRFRAVVDRGRRDEAMLLEGEHLLEEALASGVPVEVAAFADRLSGDAVRRLAARAKDAGARTFAVGDRVLAAISPVRQPSGIVAIARRRPATLEDVFERVPQLVVLLADVQDPGNVGGIVRVTEAFGGTGVVVTSGTADPFGWKALRGSMGSALRLPIAFASTLDEAAEAARAARVRLVATVPRDGTPLPDCDLRMPSAIVLGGEGAGLTADLVRIADERVTIPMRPPVESLNVSTAAASILYEASRQRQNSRRTVKTARSQ